MDSYTEDTQETTVTSSIATSSNGSTVLATGTLSVASLSPTPSVSNTSLLVRENWMAGHGIWGIGVSRLSKDCKEGMALCVINIEMLCPNTPKTVAWHPIFFKLGTSVVSKELDWQDWTKIKKYCQTKVRLVFG